MALIPIVITDLRCVCLCFKSCWRVSRLFREIPIRLAPVSGIYRCAGGWSCFPFAFSQLAFGSWESVKPIELLVPVSFIHCCTSTPGLSTWWSSTALRRDLVSREASRLDAFSGYPLRTQLPGAATGVTTGTPEVRPSRSSRTRDSSSQVSNTHGR